MVFGRGVIENVTGVLKWSFEVECLIGGKRFSDTLLFALAGAIVTGSSGLDHLFSCSCDSNGGFKESLVLVKHSLFECFNPFLFCWGGETSGLLGAVLGWFSMDGSLFASSSILSLSTNISMLQKLFDAIREETEPSWLMGTTTGKDLRGTSLGYSPEGGTCFCFLNNASPSEALLLWRVGGLMLSGPGLDGVLAGGTAVSWCFFIGGSNSRGMACLIGGDGLGETKGEGPGEK